MSFTLFHNGGSNDNGNGGDGFGSIAEILPSFISDPTSDRLGPILEIREHLRAVPPCQRMTGFTIVLHDISDLHLLKHFGDICPNIATIWILVKETRISYEVC
jgi:hypothetical protein